MIESLLLMQKSGVLHVFTFILGACIGSFLNVVIYRLPADESLVYPGSHCPSCNTEIKWYDNLPILSYLWIRGHCRFCGTGISIQYPLIELFVGLLSLGLFMRYGVSVIYPVYFLFLAGLVVASVTDLYYRMIPDVISIGGIPVGILASLIPGMPTYWADALIGAALGFLVLWSVAAGYKLLTGREGMGMGDAFLLSMIGAFLGWKALPVVLLLGSMSGLIAGVVLIWIMGKGRFYRIPFGPFLSIGALVVVYIGNLDVDIFRVLAEKMLLF